MGRLKVGVIGTGFGARVHIPAFQLHPETEVVAVASVRPGRGQQVAAELGIPRGYDNWEKMLAREDLDLVSVASAPYLHHPMTLAALARGRHVLCEKPLALDLGRTLEMARAATEASAVHAVAHEFRFLPARLKLKELLAAGLPGEILHVSWTLSLPTLAQLASRPHGWLWEAEKGGGMLGALGSHLIDSLRWWFGEFKAVSGLLTTLIPERQGHRATADDSFAFLFELASGGTGLVRLIPARHGFGSRLEVFGREGTLVLEDDRRLLAGRDGGELAPVDLPSPAPIPGAELPANPDPRLQPFLALVDQVVAAIRRGKPGQYATFHDGVRVQAVLDAVRQSHRERRWVEVPEANG